MTTTSKKVQLVFHIHDVQKTVVDKFEADDWGEFLIVRIKGLTNESELYGVYETMQKAIAQAAPNKKIILVPDGLEIDFYGIEVTDD